jgi:serine/threonine protein kinase
MSLSMGEEKRPLDEDLSRDYFRQIILAIEYLHCNGIVSFSCALHYTNNVLTCLGTDRFTEISSLRTS